MKAAQWCDFLQTHIIAHKIASSSRIWFSNFKSYLWKKIRLYLTNDLDSDTTNSQSESTKNIYMWYMWLYMWYTNYVINNSGNILTVVMNTEKESVKLTNFKLCTK